MLLLTRNISLVAIIRGLPLTYLAVVEHVIKHKICNYQGLPA